MPSFNEIVEARLFVPLSIAWLAKVPCWMKRASVRWRCALAHIETDGSPNSQ